MTLQEQIREKLKVAMKEKNQPALDTFRAVLSAFTNELVSSGKTPQDEVTDEMAQKVIQKIIKQRNDSISQFESGGREDLANAEKEQLSYLEQFMPKQLSQEEIKSIATSKKEELGISDKAKIGILVGAVMKEVGSSANGNTVKSVVESLF